MENCTANQEKREHYRLLHRVLSAFQAGQITRSAAMRTLGFKSKTSLLYWKRLWNPEDPDCFTGLRGPGRISLLSPEEQERIVRLIRELEERVTGLIAERMHRYQRINIATPVLSPAVVHNWLLEEQGVEASRPQVRRLMLKAGLWTSGERKRVPIHPSRERLPRYGSMILIDGSHHDFLSIGEPCCLMLGVDDASSKLVYARLVKRENTRGYAAMMAGIIRRYGIPRRIYSDRVSALYRRAPGGDGLVMNILTRIMSERYGVEMIAARTPQAKGRVERAFGTIQRHLPLYLLLRGIETLEGANRLLPDWVGNYNRKFAVRPAEPLSDYRLLKPGDEPEDCLAEEDRVRLSPELTFRSRGLIYQLLLPGGQKGLALKGRMVTITRSLLNGSIRVRVMGRERDFRVIGDQTRRRLKELSRKQLIERNSLRPAYRSPPSHPYRDRSYEMMLERKARKAEREKEQKK